jgi:putative membrane protein
MIRFLVATVINAFGLWVVTLLIPAVKLTPYGGTEVWQVVLSYLAVALVFGFINSVIAPVVKVIALPAYILTFGLISFVINGALLLAVAWISGFLNFGVLKIDGFTSAGLSIDSLGWAILASLILSVVAFFTRGVLKLFRIL